MHFKCDFAVPDAAKVKSYITIEKNDWICLWYHAEGVDPTWEIPELEGLTHKTWKCGGRTEHYINAHIEVRTYGTCTCIHVHSVSFTHFICLV